MIYFTEILLWLAFMLATFFLVFWMLVFLEQDTKVWYARKELKGHPFVSVVIPAYNEEQHITETLDKLSELEYNIKR